MLSPPPDIIALQTAGFEASAVIRSVAPAISSQTAGTCRGKAPWLPRNYDFTLSASQRQQKPLSHIGKRGY